MNTRIKVASLCLAAVLLVAAAALVLGFASQPVEKPDAQPKVTLSVAEEYQTEMETEFAKIIFGEVEIEKEYTISDTALAAPMPDPLCYGEVATPAEMQPILDQAAELLEGQELLFSTDLEIFPGSTIHYYLDETIFAVTWKQVYERVVFTYAEVKIAHPSQFRRYLAGGEFGSGTLYTTTQMSQSVNAVVACNGDYYAYRRKGLTVTNGTVHKCIGGVSDMCFIDGNGDLILERDMRFADAAEAQAYVDEHDVNFTLAFGPILVQDGENVCPGSYSLGDPKGEFPRSAICQMDKLHYLFVASNMEKPYYGNLTLKQFAGYVHQTGCIRAYTLDGGQTATVAMDSKLINQVNYGSERLISDIIYFATAKPAEE